MSPLIARLRELERLRTRGEWLAAAAGSSIVGWPIVSSPDGQLIANVRGDTKERTAANASLLAASPSLLELAEALEHWMRTVRADRYTPRDERSSPAGHHPFDGPYEAARTALANLARRLNVAEER